MNTICCLKWGSLYNHQYVNNLYAMVKRNLTIPFRFVCFTDDPSNFHPNIEVKSIPPNLKGWWGKTYYFTEHDWEGTVLALDLDVVIVDNIDCLFDYKPGEFVMKEDYVGHGCSSVVMRFEANKYPHIYNNLDLNKIQHSIDNKERNFKKKKYWGDQIWITEQMENNITIWPKTWIPKFSIDCHREKDSKRPYAEVFWKHRKPGEFFIPDNAKIVVFAGPNGNNVNHYHTIKQWWHSEDMQNEN